jgi:phage-related tail protein
MSGVMVLASFTHSLGASACTSRLQQQQQQQQDCSSDTARLITAQDSSARQHGARLSTASAHTATTKQPVGSAHASSESLRKKNRNATTLT